MNKDEELKLRKDLSDAFGAVRTAEKEILDLNKRMSEVMVELKDNQINDILNREDIKENIREMASKSGRKTAFKWIAAIIPAVEVIRKLLEVV